MRTLNLIKTTPKVLAEKWNNTLGIIVHLNGGDMFCCFVRCNSKGEVKWDKTAIYTHEELIDRKICIRKLKEK